MSGSKRSHYHLYALRVVLLESLPIGRIIPDTHVPKPSNHGARFSAEYLSSVNSKIMPVSQVLWIRRTVALDLRDVKDRVHALRRMIGLVAYMYSGKAKIWPATGIKHSSLGLELLNPTPTIDSVLIITS